MCAVLASVLPVRVSTHSHPRAGLDDFGDYLADKEGDNITLFVYNAERDSVREVSLLVSTKAWGANNETGLGTSSSPLLVAAWFVYPTLASCRRTIRRNGPPTHVTESRNNRGPRCANSPPRYFFGPSPAFPFLQTL